ncbi:hypothetical protein ASPZODRAFT_19662 [Penicilliopsis zonata CBS 506.65]|uniref:Uncharacterized protein n=1 Tax=Penicilliopsis zonata CBS 506.65 TaxID=1073090 RepID=A0A1L9S7Y3_9EURO|nr:hypothetical protein ASPZODRAFT_19662 [Penicilliopsis zonata CBS 506.65]OJJ43257.1 hypothetical protein ASPZODRAFT_19662 [Penicilliopsis zonata CBS 506.65]
MPENMDIDAPPGPSEARSISRDPRLIAQSLPPIPRTIPRTNSWSSGPTRPNVPSGQQVSALSPVNQQNFPLASLPQSISEFVLATVNLANYKAEKERLQKKKATTDATLRKAQAHTNFPAVISYLQQISRNEDVDLARIDESMNRHLSICRQLENTISTTMNQSQSSSQANEKVLKLEAELEKVRSEARKMHGEQAKKMDEELVKLRRSDSENQMMRTTTGFLQDRVSKLEASRKDIDSHFGMVEERQRNIDSLIKQTGDQEVSSHRQWESIERLRSELDKTTKSCGSTTDYLAQFKNEASNQLKQLHKEVADHRKIPVEIAFVKEQIKKLAAAHPQELAASTEPLKEQIAALDSRITLLKSTIPDVQKIPNLLPVNTVEVGTHKLGENPHGNGVLPMNNDETKYLKRLEALEEGINALTEIRYMADEFNQSEHHEFRQKLEAHTAELAELKASRDQVSSKLVSLGQQSASTAQAYTQIAELKTSRDQVSSKLILLEQRLSSAPQAHTQVAELSNTLKTFGQKLHTVQVALHSLETRYNNLTTEPIVRSMVSAMQEMYPAQSVLIEHVTALKNQLDSLPLDRWNNSPTEIAALRTQLEGLIQSNKILKSNTEEINQIKREFSNLLPPLITRVGRLENDSQPKPQLSEVETKVNSLSERLDAHATRFDGHLKSKETADEILIQTFNLERDRLNAELKGLHDEYQSLVNVQEELRTQVSEALQPSNLVHTQRMDDSARNSNDTRISTRPTSATRGSAQPGSSLNFGLDGQIDPTISSGSDGFSSASRSPKREPNFDENQTDIRWEDPMQGDSSSFNGSQIEKKKKKKRPRHSGVSGENGLLKATTLMRPEEDPKAKKKRKKKRKINQENPILVE